MGRAIWKCVETGWRVESGVWEWGGRRVQVMGGNSRRAERKRQRVPWRAGSGVPARWSCSGRVAGLHTTPAAPRLPLQQHAPLLVGPHLPASSHPFLLTTTLLTWRQSPARFTSARTSLARLLCPAYWFILPTVPHIQYYPFQVAHVHILTSPSLACSALHQRSTFSNAAGNKPSGWFWPFYVRAVVFVWDCSLFSRFLPTQTASEPIANKYGLLCRC